MLSKFSFASPEISILKLYEDLFRKELEKSGEPIKKRIVRNLKENKYIRGKLVQIIAGSKSDEEFVNEIGNGIKLRCDDICVKETYLSAHKNTQELLDFLKKMDKSIEPIVYITVAGRSNALSGVVACNSKFPVIACPPHKDKLDYLVNIHSSLQMPSKAPVGTVIDPKNAADYAIRILNNQ